MPSVLEKSSMELSQRQNDYLEAVTGLGISTSEVRQGLHAYALFASRRFKVLAHGQPCPASQHDSVLQDSSQDASKLLSHATAVINVLKSMNGASDTIDSVIEVLPSDVKDSILEATIFDPESATLSSQVRQQRQKQHLRVTVFCTVAIATMLFSVTSISGTHGVQIDKDMLGAESTFLALDRRPLIALMKHVGSMEMTSDPSPSPSAKPDYPLQLDVMNLSIPAISDIGRMTILWVDSLDHHLEYNSKTGQLGMFRFPSFLLATHGAEPGSFSHWMSQRLYGDIDKHKASRSSMSPPSLAAEVLVTIRLLFGQSKASRKRYRKQFKQQTEKMDLFDPLLGQICSLTDAKLCAAYPQLAPLLQTSNALFSPALFPHFGERMLAIQERVKAFRPNKLMDLYRDRRDREKFYTFWAVILFGSAAVVLGIIQVFLSAAQLALAYYQWQASLALPSG